MDEEKIVTSQHSAYSFSAIPPEIQIAMINKNMLVYPVIYVTFGDLKARCWECEEKKNLFIW